MHPQPILFDKVYLYGVMIAIGILCCFFVLYFFGRIKGIKTSFLDFTFYNAIASIGIGFFTSALFQAIYNYIDNPKEGFNLFGSGITFIGGLIGGVACFIIIYFLFRKKLKGRILDILSLVPCCITIAHAFGRLGCFFAGCCYGKETHSWLGIHFPSMSENVYSDIIYSAGYSKLYPTMLFESIFLFVLFALFSFLLIKYKFKHNMSLYLILYGLFRFFIEFIRGDERGGFIPGLSPSQFWSLIMIVGGIVLFFAVTPFFKKREQEKLLEQNALNKITTQENTEINNSNEDEQTEEFKQDLDETQPDNDLIITEETTTEV